MTLSNDQPRGITQFYGKHIDQAFTRVMSNAKRVIKILAFEGEALHLLQGRFTARYRRSFLCADLDNPFKLEVCVRIYDVFRGIAEIRHLDPSFYESPEG